MNVVIEILSGKNLAAEIDVLAEFGVAIVVHTDNRDL